MITYKTPSNYYPALTVGTRLQAALDRLHNAGPHGPGRNTLDDLKFARAEAITLWHLLWADFDGIDRAEADRIRAEIDSAYGNAVIRVSAKRGRTVTA